MKSVLETLALVGVQGTVLAAVALVVTRRVRPALQAAVWLVVLAKFALPWGPSLPFSLADVLAMLRGGESAAAPIAVDVKAAPVEAAHGSIGWALLAAAWAAGSVIVLARALFAYRTAVRAARAATPAPADAQALLGHARVRLVVGADDVGPHVVGMLRPTIVIPPALLADRTLLRAALLHELAHVRRRDALGRVVQLVAVAAFWFYPVVRLASRRLDRAREAACDAWALEAGDISRPAYARLLLQMAQLHAGSMALAAPNALDHRVAGVLASPIQPRLRAVHWGALVVWIALALGGARSAEARERGTVCVYTPELAEALRAAHPEADLDGDGVLSHEEACDFQADLARRLTANPPVSRLDDATVTLLTEPLCCNCDAAEGRSAAAPLPDASCPSEGVDR